MCLEVLIKIMYSPLLAKNITSLRVQMISYQDSWKEIASLAKPRAKAMIFQFLNKIYIFGGRQSESKLSKKIEVYNPENNLW